MTAKPATFERPKPGSEPPALDSAYLARLSRQLGQTVLDELLADGVIELTDRVARIDEAWRHGDAKGMRRLGHDLVGMSGHLGLIRLSAAAADLAQRLQAGDDNVGAAAREVCREGAVAAEALRDYLGR